jgi:hypothetical protein
MFKIEKLKLERVERRAMGMKFTLTAAVAGALAMAAATASAGVVISQEVVNTSQAGKRSAIQTVMIEGRKQKIVRSNRETITDLDAGVMYSLNPGMKNFIKTVLPPKGMMAAVMAREGVGVGYEKAAGTDKAAGYACQDYAGSGTAMDSKLEVTLCAASEAPGAKEYVDFQKALSDKLKGSKLERKGEVPYGIPVKSTTVYTQVPRPLPPQFDPKVAAQYEAHIAAANRNPPTTVTTVTKIEVKDLPADTFVVPKEFTEQQLPGLKILPGSVLKRPIMPPSAPAGAAPAPGAPAPM